MTRSIAIIGAGLLGSLTALDLARRGFSVDLIDRNDDGVGEASYFNEGKVHLGFLYAQDRTMETSRLMARGAAVFRPIVQDLVGFDVSGSLSTPFLYAVHRDSLVSPEDFESHLLRCCEQFAAIVESGPEQSCYVDGSRRIIARRLSEDEWSSMLDPGSFAAVFATSEFSVDPRTLARQVNDAVAKEGRVERHMATRVDRVIPRADARWSLLREDGSPVGRDEYDIVVNATWSDLLRLDAQVGIEPPQEWSYRYKLGNRVSAPLAPGALPSVTVVLGAFGDIVNFGASGAFVSWYPSGRLMMTSDIDLPDWNGDGYKSIREEAYRDSLSTWESLSPALASLNFADEEADTRGGMILATGRTDVDDPASPLHSRVQVGVECRGTYVSVNTGKYTLAPMIAKQASDVVVGLLT